MIPTTQNHAPVPVLPNIQARIRAAGILRAQADTLFIESDRLENYRRNCAASNNPRGAAIWQRLANHFRTEAEACVFEADKLVGARP